MLEFNRPEWGRVGGMRTEKRTQKNLLNSIFIREERQSPMSRAYRSIYASNKFLNVIAFCVVFDCKLEIAKCKLQIEQEEEGLDRGGGMGLVGSAKIQGVALGCHMQVLWAKKTSDATTGICV
jgi:hypothetical protein